MRIIVDEDACPVKDIIVKIARIRNIEVFLFSNYSHNISSDYAHVVTVDKFSQSVDFAIVNFMKAGDIIVTQDYGLAALVLSRKGFAIGNSGLIYTNENIDGLLMQRHTSQQLRKTGIRVHQQHKRSKEEDVMFAESLNKIISGGYENESK